MITHIVTPNCIQNYHYFANIKFLKSNTNLDTFLPIPINQPALILITGTTASGKSALLQKYYQCNQPSTLYENELLIIGDNQQPINYEPVLIKNPFKVATQLKTLQRIIYKHNLIAIQTVTTNRNTYGRFDQLAELPHSLAYCASVIIETVQHHRLINPMAKIHKNRFNQTSNQLIEL